MQELEQLAGRVGSISELVKPTARAEVAGLTDAEIAHFLSENPNSVRRPIIDTGEWVTLGFTPAVREKLGGGPGSVADGKVHHEKSPTRNPRRMSKSNRPKG